MNISPSVTPVLPQPVHFATTFCESRKLFMQRPSELYARKYRDRSLTNQIYVGYPYSSMDGRADIIPFDPKRRRTLIDETAEIRFVHPADQLEYSKYRVDFDVLEGIRQLDLHRRERFTKRLYIRMKSVTKRVWRKFLDFFHVIL